MDIQIGDVVKRSGHKDYGNGFGVETGDVIEKTGERCRVAWRDRMVPGFYRPEELVKRPGPPHGATIRTATTKQREVEYLGKLHTTHIVAVDRESVIVHDNITSFEVSGRAQESYTVTARAGVVVSNSEVGQGSLRVEALDFRLVCLNGMIREAAVRKAHLGRGSRGQDAIEDAREYFRLETQQADDRAFFLKVQDASAFHAAG